MQVRAWKARACYAALAVLAGLLAGGCASRPAAQPPPDDVRALARAWRIERNPGLERNWGTEIVGVRLVASGWMLQLKYRVVDPDRARLLFTANAKPYLRDKASGVVFAVPAMDNVGELRQAAPKEAGRTYFVMFGNANKLVQRGDRIAIDIGTFHADDIVVE